MRASAASLGPEPQLRRKAIISAAAPAAVMLAKKYGSHLEEHTYIGDQVVVNLTSRPPKFLGSASSAPEGLGSQIGANYV